MSKCMKANGIATVSFDIRLGDPLPGKQDAMDLLSDAGFSLFNCIASNGLLMLFVACDACVLCTGKDRKHYCAEDS